MIKWAEMILCDVYLWYMVLVINWPTLSQCWNVFLPTFQELNQERAKLAATIKSLQEKAEEKLKTELEQKVVSLFHFVWNLSYIA